MAKAINWPTGFREEIIAEDCEQLRCAFRLGSLYYENRYWTPDEIVDIRVNHLKIRKATVVGDLQQYALNQLPTEVLACQKTSLKTHAAIAAYLAETYGQPVDGDTPITVVFYRNLPIVPEELESPDDPHL